MPNPASASDNPQWISDQYDEIRWGQSKSGNVPAGASDDYADSAGLPRLPESADGLEHIQSAHDAAKRRWHPPRGVSEFDPVSSEPRHQVSGRRWLR